MPVDVPLIGEQAEVDPQRTAKPGRVVKAGRVGGLERPISNDSHQVTPVTGRLHTFRKNRIAR